MANTITQKTLEGSGDDTLISRIIHVEGDGTPAQVSDQVIFDNSAFIADVTKGRLLCVEAWGSTTNTGINVILEWDQTTDSEIVRFHVGDGSKIDFTKLGGGHNPVGAGATGDILLTTTGIAANEAFTLKIIVQQA